MEQASMRWQRQSEGRLTLERLKSDRAPPTIAEEVTVGLAARQKQLPCKYFYDHRGSLLFEKICQTPEYYPSRAEDRLLRQIAPQVIGAIAPSSVIELGSGSSRKTRRLFAACNRHGHRPSYVPIDVCPQMLASAGAQLISEFDWLEVNALVGDYTLGFEQLRFHESPALFVFLGGTIGNFTDAELSVFLSGLRAVMHPGDYLLLGADLVKEEAVLHAAYNDAAGLTAAFNLNLLQVINRELEGDFRNDGFVHHARYDRSRSRIEMRLISIRDQEVFLGGCGRSFAFAADETILTEISRKFTPDALTQHLAQSRLGISQLFVSEEPQYALVLANPL